MAPHHRILITGASGYLGGSLLAEASRSLPASTSSRLFALVRTDAQAEAVKQHYTGVEPLVLPDAEDEDAVRQAIVGNGITIVYFLIDALGSTGAHGSFVRALAEVKAATGGEVHFLHTSGAKMFSSHAGAPTDRPLLDTDPELYAIQQAQAQRAVVPIMQSGVDANCTVLQEAEKHGVRAYIFAPCIVYGQGKGFGRKISIQTAAIVKAAKAMARVYKPDAGRPTWPVCHVDDTTALYMEILRHILDGSRDPGHGKHAGYYLAASGSVAWDDLYKAMAAALAERHVVGDDSVVPANESILAQMGEVLGCPPESVSVMMGGHCTFTAEHGKRIGWQPRFSPGHILETAADEVALILDHI